MTFKIDEKIFDNYCKHIANRESDSHFKLGLPQMNKSDAGVQIELRMIFTMEHYRKELHNQLIESAGVTRNNTKFRKWLEKKTGERIKELRNMPENFKSIPKEKIRCGLCNIIMPRNQWEKHSTTGLHAESLQTGHRKLGDYLIGDTHEL